MNSFEVVFYVSRLILFNLRWSFKLWRQEGRRATIRGVIPRISISNTNPAVTTRVYIREVAAGRAHNPQIGVYIGSVLRNWLTLRRPPSGQILNYDVSKQDLSHDIGEKWSTLKGPV